VRCDIEVTPHTPHREAVRDAFAAGLAAHGERWTEDGPPVTWGPRPYDHYLCLEAGYLTAPEGAPYTDRRLAYISATWDGYGNRGRTPAFRGKRFDILARPWREGGDYALILAQCSGDRAVPEGYLQILSELARGAKEVYGDARIRPHPVRQAHVTGIPVTSGTLAEDLEGAVIAMTWSSTSAVEAVLAGVPAVCLDEGAVAWPVSGHAVGERLTPDRDEWLASLSWRNWTLEEIRSGEMWDFMKAVL
jgi:hypothetical protein